jgi:predicted permease
MRVLREWAHRIGGTLLRRRRDADLEEELRFHLELAAEEAQRRGETPEQAARAARLRLGGVSQSMESMRDRRGVPWLEELARDVRHGARGLRRSPGFTVVALLILVLGIGANTAIFTIVRGVILRPLGYTNPEQLMALSTPGQELSQPEYLEVRDASQSFADVGAFTTDDVNLIAGDRTQRVRAATVDGQLLAALRISPSQGRLIARGETDVTRPWLPGNPDNEQPPPIAILSHELWQSAFGGRPMLGEWIEVNRRRYEVIGVMPPGADVMDNHVQVWLPLGLNPSQRHAFLGYHFLNVVGRLRNGVSVASAQAELSTVMSRFGAQLGGVEGAHLWHVRMTPAHDAILAGASRSIWILQAAAGLVLLIACTNLANLLLARAETRRREIAVRAALGAGRGRLLRQSLVEGLLLSIAGGVLGLGVARAGVATLLASFPASLPRTNDVAVDLPVLLFTLGVSVAAGVVFGLAPLAHARATGLMAALKDAAARGGAGPSRHRVRRALVIIEVALAMTVVIGAGLLVRTAQNLTAVDAGFDRSRLVTFSITSIAPMRGEMYQRVLNTLRSVPGVQAATAMSGLPPTRLPDGEQTELEGYTAPNGEPYAGVDYFQSVMTGYFDTMGISIVAGRGFEPADAASSGMVAIVNESLAEKFWKGKNPIGQHLRPQWGDWVPMFTVVGVAKDVKQGGVDRKTATEFYFFVDQMARRPSPLGRAPLTINVVLRTTLHASALANTIERAVREADRTVAVARLREMEDVFAESISRPRLLAQLIGAFAALALLLAAVGTYGVLSYVVAQRRREMGIRLALGADRARLVGHIVTQGLALTAAGVAIGLIGAFGLSRVMTSLLFGVAPTDLTTSLSVVVAMTALGALSSSVPAWRASRVDPCIVLRGE